jgi:hypothetical protein
LAVRGQGDQQILGSDVLLRADVMANETQLIHYLDQVPKIEDRRGHGVLTSANRSELFWR